MAEAVRHYYAIYGGDLKGKRVIIQGWGNVGSAAAYYLAQAGARIVGIIDRDGGLLDAGRLQLRRRPPLFLDKDGNQLVAEGMLPFEEINRAGLGRGSRDLPALRRARGWSRATDRADDRRRLEVVSCGANVPFDDPEIFYGPIYEYADSRSA